MEEKPELDSLICSFLFVDKTGDMKDDIRLKTKEKKSSENSIDRMKNAAKRNGSKTNRLLGKNV